MKRTDLENYIKKANCDVYLFNETKIGQKDFEKSQEDIENYFSNLGYSIFENCAPKGYSGVMAAYREQPLNLLRNYEYIEGSKVRELFKKDEEGRILTLEYLNFYLISVYVPTSGAKNVRLNFKTKKWSPWFYQYVQLLNWSKPVIIGGDMNVARNELDLYNPKKYQGHPSYNHEERESIEMFLEQGFADVWRLKN